MRLATYNVEWFDRLFDDKGRLLADDEWSARHNVTRRQQAEALGIVFTALDADAVMVIEAPDSGGRRGTVRALETFARTFGLRTRKAVTGFASETQQEIALLFDPDRLSARHDPKGEPFAQHHHVAPRFDTAFKWDIDVDAHPETIRFSKPPLELDVRTTQGHRLRMIGVHLKSKAPHGANDAGGIVATAIDNRRKQLAQAIWLRHRIVEHLAAGDDLVVMGDFNDGPSLDDYERLFGHSTVELVMGHDEPPEMRLFDPHAAAALDKPVGPAFATARFWRNDLGRYMPALLDYIMISPGLMSRRPAWRIWHPFDDPACYETPELREALLQASDHFPVSLDIEL